MAIAVTFLEQDKQTPTQVAVQLADFLNAAKTSLHIAIAENIVILHDASLAEQYNDYIEGLVKRYAGQR